MLLVTPEMMLADLFKTHLGVHHAVSTTLVSSPVAIGLILLTIIFRDIFAVNDDVILICCIQKES